MRYRILKYYLFEILRSLLFGCFVSLIFLPVVFAQDVRESFYTTRDPSLDGIGKIYMGREISQVMGAGGILWLERDNRAAEELPDAVVHALELKPADVVADIGCGSGYFSFRIAAQLSQGNVFAVDIDPEMLRIIINRRINRGMHNVIPVLGAETDPKLTDMSIDLAFMADTYHEFSHPREMMEAIVRALKPNGRVVLVEYKAEDPTIPIKPLHKMTLKQVQLEMEAVGLTFKEAKDFLPTQHFVVFEKGE